MCMCGYGCGCAYMPWCACDVGPGGQLKGVGSDQIYLKLSDLAARTFTHLKIFPALHFKKLTCWFLQWHDLPY